MNNSKVDCFVDLVDNISVLTDGHAREHYDHDALDRGVNNTGNVKTNLPIQRKILPLTNECTNTINTSIYTNYQI